MAREGETILKFPVGARALMEWYWAAPLLRVVALQRARGLQAPPRLEGHADHVPLRRGRLRRLDELPDEAALEQAPARPSSSSWCRRSRSPTSRAPLRALLASRYPHGKLHVVVVTKEEEERSPHPAMGLSTAELVRRFRAGAAARTSRRCSRSSPCRGPAARRISSTGPCASEHLRALLGDDYDPRRVYVGVSDADSIPDRNVYRWLAADVHGRAAGASRTRG